MLPWRRLGPDECSAGNKPDVGHELAWIVKAQEVLQLGHERDSSDQLHATHGLQGLHQRGQAPVGQDLPQGLLQARDTGTRLRDRVQVFLQADLLSGVLHLQRSQPAQMGAAPGGLAGIGDTVAQQQCLQAVACIALFAHRVLTGAHEVAHGLIGRAGYAHDGKVVGASQPCQLHRVAPVGLDAFAWRSWNRRRGDDIAGPAQGSEVPLQHKAAGAGLIDDVQPVPRTDQFAHRLAHRVDTPGDCPQVAHLGGARRVGHCDVDAVLVNVQTDVQSARFLHGPSPRKFATPRPPVGPVHWCSSARLWRATYVVAGDGPPEFTKPSCLGVECERDWSATSKLASMTSIRACPLPPQSLLSKYVGGDAYTDCYTTELAKAVSHAEYVASFYTGGVFKIERHLLSLFLSKPSTDEQARQLAAGDVDKFSAWRVEDRSTNQLLMCAIGGRTRSWLMVSPALQGETQTTRLYFGSAVVPAVNKSTGKSSMGFLFIALLGFHKLYSRVLLGSARARLARSSH